MTIERLGLVLDVTLRRNGTTRRWTISAKAGRWTCRYTDANRMSFNGCDTLESALAKKAEWEAEINLAKANGWAESPHSP